MFMRAHVSVRLSIYHVLYIRTSWRHHPRVVYCARILVGKCRYINASLMYTRSSTIVFILIYWVYVSDYHQMSASRCLASHQYQLSSCNSFCIVVMICNYSKHPTTKTNQKNHVIYDVSTCCVNKTHIFAFVSAIHRFRIRIANQKYTHVLIM